MDEMDFENRIVASGYSQEDADVELSLRPQRFEDYIGQDKVKEKITSLTVDAKDLTTLARHVAKIETITDETLLKNADVDGENGITAADLTKLARYVAKIISEL